MKNRNLFILMSIAFLDSLALFIIVPVMPDLLKEITGQSVEANAVWAGRLTTIYAVMQFIFAPILGYFSDKYGRKKIFIFSAVTFSLNFLLMAITHNIWFLFIGRLCTGISGASLSTVMASVTDISTNENRVENFGKIFGVFGLGMVLGPAIGGAFGDFGARAPFWISLGFWIINLLVITLFFTETLSKDKRATRSIKNPFRSVLNMSKYSGFPYLFIGNLLFMVAFQAIIVVSSFYTTAKFHWTPKDIGWSMTVFGIAYILTQTFLVKKIYPILGNLKTLLFGVFFCIIGYFMVGFAPSVGFYYAGLILFAICSVANAPVSNLFAINVKDSEQGSIQGALTSITSIAEIIGPYLLSFIFNYVMENKLPLEGGLTFIASAFIAILSVTFYIKGYNKLKVK